MRTRILIVDYLIEIGAREVLLKDGTLLALDAQEKIIKIINLSPAITNFSLSDLFKVSAKIGDVAYHIVINDDDQVWLEPFETTGSV